MRHRYSEVTIPTGISRSRIGSSKGHLQAIEPGYPRAASLSNIYFGCSRDREIQIHDRSRRAQPNPILTCRQERLNVENKLKSPGFYTHFNYRQPYSDRQPSVQRRQIRLQSTMRPLNALHAMATVATASTSDKSSAPSVAPSLWDGHCFYPTGDTGFQLESYVGRWYQVAGTLAPFTAGCKCIFAEYALNVSVESSHQITLHQLTHSAGRWQSTGQQYL